MKIIFSKLFKQSQVGPAFEDKMEQEVAREEAARRRMRELEGEPKKKSKLRAPRKSIFDVLSLNDRAKEMDTNKETNLERAWQSALGKLKN
jgi:hypothetical protein